MRLGFRRTCLQRLFSTFAEGWPGAGLLLQRVLTSTSLFYLGAPRLTETVRTLPNALSVLAAVAGILLLLGLWTPVAGITIAIAQTLMLFLSPGNALITILLASLGITLAMIGPGIWSIDARLYGRRYLEDPRH